MLNYRYDEAVLSEAHTLIKEGKTSGYRGYTMRKKQPKQLELPLTKRRTQRVSPQVRRLGTLPLDLHKLLTRQKQTEEAVQMWLLLGCRADVARA